MSCIHCSSERVLEIQAHCSDCFSMTFRGKTGQGYVPRNMFFSKNCGDDVNISFCLDCGKVQDDFPVSGDEIDDAFSYLGSEYDVSSGFEND